MCVFIQLHIIEQSGHVTLVILCHCVDPFEGVFVCVFVCVFIELHITAQFGHVILVILWCVCVYVCVCIC